MNMDLKIPITFFLVTISSLIYHGNSGADPDFGNMMGAVAGCLPKLLPCQKFLGPDNDEKPTAACCDPLKEVMEQEVKCLCNAFQNPTMLAAINVTKDDIMKLPKSCGLDANEDICKSVSISPISDHSSDISFSTPATDKSSKPESTDSNYAAKGVAYMSGYSIVALVVALIVSA